MLSFPTRVAASGERPRHDPGSGLGSKLGSKLGAAVAGCSGFREAGLRELAHHELARDWRAPGDGHLQVRRFEHSREQPASLLEPFLTDQGNFILDCAFGRIPEPEVLAFALKRVPGVVEHGLFLGVADMAIVATDSGVQILQRTPSGE